jgi:hypothetical protein
VCSGAKDAQLLDIDGGVLRGELRAGPRRPPQRQPHDDRAGTLLPHRLWPHPRQLQGKSSHTNIDVNSFVSC